MRQLYVGSIWHRRNNFVFKQEFACPSKVLLEANNEVDNYKQAHISLVNMKKALDKVARNVEWKKLNDRIFKANWDASYCAPSSKKIGIEIVMRDAAVKLIAALSKTVDHVASPKIVEIATLKKQ